MDLGIPKPLDRVHGLLWPKSSDRGLCKRVLLRDGGVGLSERTTSHLSLGNLPIREDLSGAVQGER